MADDQQLHLSCHDQERQHLHHYQFLSVDQRNQSSQDVQLRPVREVEVEVEMEQREDEHRRVREGAREIHSRHCNYEV